MVDFQAEITLLKVGGTAKGECLGAEGTRRNTNPVLRFNVREEDRRTRQRAIEEGAGLDEWRCSIAPHRT